MKSKIFDKINKKGEKRAKVQSVSKKYKAAEWNSPIWNKFLQSNGDHLGRIKGALNRVGNLISF